MYIESHIELRHHPKRKRLSRLLCTTERETIGLLHVFWWWVMEYAPDGNLAGLTEEDIDDGCDCTGAYKNLRESGFIDADNTVHDWFEYGGKFIEKRNSDRERKQRKAEELKISGGIPMESRRNSDGIRQNSSGFRRIPKVTEQSRAEQNMTEHKEESSAKIFSENPEAVPGVQSDYQGSPLSRLLGNFAIELEQFGSVPAERWDRWLKRGYSYEQLTGEMEGAAAKFKPGGASEESFLVAWMKRVKPGFPGEDFTNWLSPTNAGRYRDL